MRASDAAEPFGFGSVSLGLHPPSGVSAREQVLQLLHQAELAEKLGFDGVTLSEHHAGFPGYLPQPLQALSWLLERAPRLWGAAAPTLLGLRSPALLGEEAAWLAARYPHRVALAVAPGYASGDFAATGVDVASRLERFPDLLAALVNALSPHGPLAGDPAIEAAGRHLGPVLLAVNSQTAARRAAGHGLGVLYPGGERADRLASLRAVYRAASGQGPVVGILSVWIGPKPSPDQGLVSAEDVYRTAAAPGMRQTGGFAQPPFEGGPADVVAAVCRFVGESGITAVNLRVRAGGASSDVLADQLTRVARELLPHVRRAFRTD